MIRGHLSNELTLTFFKIYIKISTQNNINLDEDKYMTNENHNKTTAAVEEIAELEKEYEELQFQMTNLLAKREEVREKLVERRQWKYL